MGTSNDPTATRVAVAWVLARLGVCRMTLDRWIKAGKFPAPHYLGEQRRWWLHEVQAWEAAEAARPPEARRRARPLRPATDPGSEAA